jgi:SAM-dependent methyltransferase
LDDLDDLDDETVDDDTARALNALNAAFYREHGADFSAHRTRPWRGWTRLLDWIPESEAGLQVLDVGCGNGRFGRFLADHRRLGLYVGVDASEPLLAIAQEASPPLPCPCRFECRDFVERRPDEALPRGDFDLVVLFGVLHGVPGRERRRALLEASSARLAPGGLLAFTCWGFAQDARLAGRIASWERSPVPVDPLRLEPGDHLLPWGDSGQVLRYGASVDAEQRAWLTSRLAAEPVAEFAEDGPGGDLNHYTVLRAPRDPR